MKETARPAAGGGARGPGRPGRVGRLCAAPAVLAVALVMSLALAGCRVGLVTDTTVNLDGSGTMSLRLSADKEILEFLVAQEVEGRSIDLFAELKAVLPPMWPIEEGEEPDGSPYLVLSVPFVDGGGLAAVTSRGEDALLAGLGISRFELSREQDFFIIRTTYRTTVDLAAALSTLQVDGAESSGEGLEGEEAWELAVSAFSYENRVRLPGSVARHNADEVVGKTLVWRSASAPVLDMQAESVALRWGSVASLLAAVAVAFLVMAAVFLSIRRRRRERMRESPPWAG